MFLREVMMFRVSTRWRTALLAAVLPAAGIGGCESSNEFKPPPPPTVTVAQPVVRPLVDFAQFTGTTQATATVDLRARVSGYLEQITFEDGATVQEDELLFVIDQTLFQVRLQAAEADLQKAEANRDLATTELARIERLYNRGAATESELTVQRAEQATTTAEVAVAQAAVRQAQKQLDYTEIRAPITGRIGRHLIDVGNLVREETTHLATIESIDPMHAYFSISESDLLRLRQLDQMQPVSSSDSPEDLPELYLGIAEDSQSEAGDDDFPHRGHFDFRELGVDPQTGTILGRGIFPNADGALLPGLFVRVRIPLGEPTPRLLIDERAIGADQRGEYVMVVNEKNVVERRTVELGRLTGGLYVVESGLEADDWIVVNGLQRARPGAEVTPQREEREETEPQMTQVE